MPAGGATSRIGRLLELVRELIECQHGEPMECIDVSGSREVPFVLCRRCGTRLTPFRDRPTLLEQLAALGSERVTEPERRPFVEGTFVERDDWPHVHIAKAIAQDSGALEQQSLCGAALHSPRPAWAVTPAAIPGCSSICPLCLRIAGVVTAVTYRNPNPGKAGLS